MAFDRRSFLQLLGGGAFAAGLSESIARALAIPANNKTGSIADVEHIVFMMQENRSFDHYFGTLSGVRGFGDPRAVTLATGNSVFHQPDDAGGYVLPFHPTAANLGLQFLEDLAHDWTTTHLAWNQGNYDQWVPAKTYITMAHLQRGDIPFHYALADAFTICDAYHSSLLGPTDPNRFHLFSGWVGNSGAGGGPVIDNSEAGYSWSTFPEALEAGGISWKVYQDIGLGLDSAGSWGNTKDNPYIGNYGDNALLYFDQYRNAQPGSPLYEKARTGTHVAVSGTLFDDFRKDVLGNVLPSVSWVVAPEAYSEHPNWPANYGAYYVSEILNALTANPDVWSKTVFLVVYDENDGFFDHVVPPTPPQTAAQGLSNVSIANEIYPGSAGNPSGPYGLGARVPMLVISPWSKGGWVNSEVFDHTSLIRLVEKRFGTSKAPLKDTNITAWRGAVTGDLTSAFNFATPNAAKVSLPNTATYAPPDALRHDSYIPPPPLLQSLPVQESGTRPARAVPYVLNVNASAASASGEVTLEFANAGQKAAVFHVRSNNILLPPRSYTLSAQSRLSDVWGFAVIGLDAYDLSIHGPNGFFRACKGGLVADASANVQSAIAYNVSNGAVTLTAVNKGTADCELSVLDVYTSETVTKKLAAGAKFEQVYSLSKHFGWYDFVLKVVEDGSFRQQLAGHLETGKDSTTDPRIATKSVTVGA
jgi:phospholipase C